MESVIKRLVKIGHGMGAEVANDEPAVAKLLVELSSALDVQYERANALEAKCAALAAENAGLKSALNPEVIPDAAVEAFTETAIMGHDWNETGEWSWVENDADVIRAVLEAINPETPATDSFLAEVRAQGVTEYATKRGFSFQHGSIHAHFGNGDVMVGATKFENGHAGICFAPVREKEGGVGTEYKWTEGKNTEQVDSVFVISSSNIEGLEVIQGKLSEAITQLRQEAAQ